MDRPTVCPTEAYGILLGTALVNLATCKKRKKD